MQLLTRFEKRLQEARQEFETGEHAGRSGAILAIGTVVEFILSIDRLKRQNLALPLVLTMAALSDLDVGKSSPLFTPTSYGNRPPDESKVQSVRVYAAWTLEWLMQLGLKKDEAASQVADRLEGAGFPFGQLRGSPQKTVASWRDRLKQDKAPRYEMDLWRDKLAEGILFPPTDGPAARQRILLDKLEHVARSVRADISK